MQGETLGMFLALLQSACWAGTSVILRVLSKRLDAYVVNGLRALAGWVVVILLTVLTGGFADWHLLTWQRLVFLVVPGILGGVFGDALYVYSLKAIGISRAFPISNMYPLFTVLLSALLLHERITWMMVVGMGLVLFGVYLVAHPRGPAVDEPSTISRAELVKGVLLALGTAVIWGSTAVMLTYGLKGIDSALANTVRVPLVALIGLLVAARRGTLVEVKAMSKSTVLLLILAGVLGWGVGSWFFTSALQLAGASKTTIIGAAAPLFATPLSMLFLRERPGKLTLAGTFLTVLGIALVV
ncbi:MAG: DMT family transporter [Chloroflexi bacterium]|nr:DMT family transporter [Chloroflexota bacterium]